jgi:hypothetical protein
MRHDRDTDVSVRNELGRKEDPGGRSQGAGEVMADVRVLVAGVCHYWVVELFARLELSRGVDKREIDEGHNKRAGQRAQKARKMDV